MKLEELKEIWEAHKLWFSSGGKQGTYTSGLLGAFMRENYSISTSIGVYRKPKPKAHPPQKENEETIQ